MTEVFEFGSRKAEVGKIEGGSRKAECGSGEKEGEKMRRCEGWRNKKTGARLKARGAWQKKTVRYGVHNSQTRDLDV
jgi:hypothetical protein